MGANKLILSHLLQTHLTSAHSNTRAHEMVEQLDLQAFQNSGLMQQKKNNAFAETRLDTDIDEHPGKEDDEDGTMSGDKNEGTIDHSLEKSLSGTVHFPPIMQPRAEYKSISGDNRLLGISKSDKQLIRVLRNDSHISNM